MVTICLKGCSTALILSATFGKKNGVDLCLTDYIDDHAEMLSQWKAQSHYILGYIIEQQKIDRAMEEINAFLKCIAKASSGV